MVGLFEVFLLVLSFYGLTHYTGLSRYTVPLACLFCIFWVQKLEKRMREEEEAKKRLLQYRLRKHRELEEQGFRKAHASAAEGEE